MGEQLTPADVTTFMTPMVEIETAATLPGEMADYFGITLNSIGGRTILVNALPFRAYNLIWNQWFRDQDLAAVVDENSGDGPDISADYQLRRRGKRHDYFTSARPWPQKPYNIDAFSNLATFPANYVPGQNQQFGPSARAYGIGAPVSGLGLSAVTDQGAVGPVWTSGSRAENWLNSTNTSVNPLYARLNSAATAPDVRVLVNDIRTAVMVQGFMERNARGGTRYTEIVRSQFGVTSPDARLQRPEYLGGGRAHVTVNPVAQTSATEVGGTVLGELAGVGTAVASGHGFSQSFTEHGVLLGLVSVRADLSYQNGTHRMWFRRTQFDFYWPGFAHLGEQAVFSKEIYSEGVPANDDLVFGYQERWSEYKYKPSRISGAFRSSYATPIDVWHLAQEFSTRPVLNEAFVEENPPFSRVLQVVTAAGEEFLCDAMFDCRWVRAMPMFSIPGLGPRL